MEISVFVAKRRLIDVEQWMTILMDQCYFGQIIIKLRINRN